MALFTVVCLTPDAAPFASWGYRGDAFQVWSGAAWVLLASAVIHQAPWHLALNIYWLWSLGRVVEGAFGPLVVGLLLITSAFVSSSFQLAIFDNVGVGASGMAFAVFGFGWLARGKKQELRATFTTKVVVLFVSWFVGCWAILTRVVGNGAHLGGLLFGAVVAEAFVMRRRPRLAKAGAIVLVVLALGVSFVCPWSATWWSTMGYRAHAGRQFDLAIEAYDTSLQLRPDQPWVMASLIRAYRASGKADAAASLLARLRSVSPSEAAKLDEELKRGR
jgi:GlpG protein